MLLLFLKKQSLTQTFFGALAKTANGFVLYDNDGKNLAFSKQADIREPWVALRQDKEARIYHPKTGSFVGGSYDSITFVGPFAVAYRIDSARVFFNATSSILFHRLANFTFLPGRDSLIF